MQFHTGSTSSNVPSNGVSMLTLSIFGIPFEQIHHTYKIIERKEELFHEIQKN